MSMKPTNSPLSMREHEVARFLAHGYTCREIAGMLDISTKTVDTHRQAVLRKLQCGNAVQVSLYFIREGWMAAPTKVAAAAGDVFAEAAIVAEQVKLLDESAL